MLLNINKQEQELLLSALQREVESYNVHYMNTSRLAEVIMLISKIETAKDAKTE